MTVYVDDMRLYARVGNINAYWSHLFADTSQELHDFAAKLELKRTWVQYEGSLKEHYDVTDTKRVLALHLGAQPLSYPHETGKYMRKRRQEKNV